MKNLSNLEFWFVTGNQHLYGPEAFAHVGTNLKKIDSTLADSIMAILADSPYLALAFIAMWGTYRIVVKILKTPIRFSFRIGREDTENREE